MFGGCPCCLYLSISGAVQFISRGRGRVEALASCCTKRQTRQKNGAGAVFSSPYVGAFPSLSIFVHIRGRANRRGRCCPYCPRCPYSGRCCVDAAPLGGAVLRLSGFGLLLYEKDGAGDTSQQKGERCTRGKRTARGGLLFPLVGAVVHVVYIGRRFVSRRLRLFALPLLAPRAGVLV